MDELRTLIDFIDTVGTFGVLIGALWLVYTGRVKFRTDFDAAEKRHADAVARSDAEWNERFNEQEADFQRELAYVEARRAEERADKLAVQSQVTVLAEAVDRASTYIQALRDVIRGGPSHGGT